jgi:hypothetical protein
MIPGSELHGLVEVQIGAAEMPVEQFDGNHWLNISSFQ